jgi:hypothetical protein
LLLPPNSATRPRHESKHIAGMTRCDGATALGSSRHCTPSYSRVESCVPAPRTVANPVRSEVPAARASLLHDEVDELAGHAARATTSRESAPISCRSS